MQDGYTREERKEMRKKAKLRLYLKFWDSGTTHEAEIYAITPEQYKKLRPLVDALWYGLHDTPVPPPEPDTFAEAL